MGRAPDALTRPGELSGSAPRPRLMPGAVLCTIRFQNESEPELRALELMWPGAGGQNNSSFCVGLLSKPELAFNQLGLTHAISDNRDHNQHTALPSGRALPLSDAAKGEGNFMCLAFC